MEDNGDTGEARLAIDVRRAHSVLPTTWIRTARHPTGVHVFVHFDPTLTLPPEL